MGRAVEATREHWEDVALRAGGSAIWKSPLLGLPCAVGLFSRDGMSSLIIL